MTQNSWHPEKQNEDKYTCTQIRTAVLMFSERENFRLLHACLKEQHGWQLIGLIRWYIGKMKENNLAPPLL